MLIKMCSVVIPILWLTVIQLADGKSFNRSAYQHMIDTKVDDAVVKYLTNPKETGQEITEYTRLQKKYFMLQSKYYQEAVKLAAKSQSSKAYHNVEASCAYCQQVGDDRITCFTECLTDQLNIYSDLSKSIASTMYNMFCRPIGFKFLEEYYSQKDTKIFTNFVEFVKGFSHGVESMSVTSLVDIWISNVLLVQQSPLFFYSYLKGNMVNTILNAGTYELTNIDVDNLPPATFASMCGSTFAADIAPDIHSFLTAAKDNSHLLDVVMRGLFAIRSATFYAPGSSYQHAATGIIEVMGAIIGRKCDLFGEGEQINCDQTGKLPVPNFPFPDVAMDLAPKCE